MTARALIRASAIGDLEALRTPELRRAAVRLASEAVADPDRRRDRIHRGAVGRRRLGRLAVLYTRRGDDVVVEAVTVEPRRRPA